LKHEQHSQHGFVAQAGGGMEATLLPQQQQQQEQQQPAPDTAPPAMEQQHLPVVRRRHARPVAEGEREMVQGGLQGECTMPVQVGCGGSGSHASVRVRVRARVRACKLHGHATGMPAHPHAPRAPKHTQGPNISENIWVQCSTDAAAVSQAVTKEVRCGRMCQLHLLACMVVVAMQPRQARTHALHAAARTHARSAGHNRTPTCTYLSTFSLPPDHGIAAVPHPRAVHHQGAVEQRQGGDPGEPHHPASPGGAARAILPHTQAVVWAGACCLVPVA